MQDPSSNIFVQEDTSHSLQVKHYEALEKGCEDQIQTFLGMLFTTQKYKEVVQTKKNEWLLKQKEF